MTAAQIAAAIEAYGVPIHLQVGDQTPVLVGWIDHRELAAAPGPAVARFLRDVATHYDAS